MTPLPTLCKLFLSVENSTKAFSSEKYFKLWFRQISTSTYRHLMSFYCQQKTSQHTYAGEGTNKLINCPNSSYLIQLSDKWVPAVG